MLSDCFEIYLEIYNHYLDGIKCHPPVLSEGGQLQPEGGQSPPMSIIYIYKWLTPQKNWK